MCMSHRAHHPEVAAKDVITTAVVEDKWAVSGVLRQGMFVFWVIASVSHVIRGCVDIVVGRPLDARAYADELKDFVMASYCTFKSTLVRGDV